MGWHLISVGSLHPLACTKELLECLIVCSWIDIFLWFRDDVFSGSLSSASLSITASRLRLGAYDSSLLEGESQPSQWSVAVTWVGVNSQ